ncbi:MAG: hypothetical protein M5U26_13005 [Planctomycetota bacterium]|nr:hypothetical protein [Planctomycetota bacterium]
MIATRCCAGLLLGLLVLPARAADPELDAREAPSGKRARSFTFTYQAFVKEVPAGAKKLKLWIPVPRSDAHQTIGNVKIAPCKTGVQENPRLAFFNGVFIVA